jgi:hypothetical protein
MRVSFKMVGLLAVLVLAMGFVFQGTALADPPQTPVPGDGAVEIPVDTSAHTGVGGSAPSVNYKWENVDMSEAEGSFSYFDGSDNADDDVAAGLQFWPWLGDDPEPLVCGIDNDGDTAVDEDAIDGLDNDLDGVIDEDDPCLEARQVRYWAAVHDTNGLGTIDEVWVKVYEPLDNDGDTLVDEDPASANLIDEDGDCGRGWGAACLATEACCDEDSPDKVLKYKLHLHEVACSSIGTMQIVGVDTIITLADPLLAAVATGQISEADAELLVELCYNSAKKIYMGEANVSKEQPAGQYRVEAYARDTSGNDSPALVNHFTVLSIVGLVIDFAGGIDFGEIEAEEEVVIVGDGNMSTPALPTVQNIGNDPMYLWLHFTPMDGTIEQYMSLVDFDAVFQMEGLYFTGSDDPAAERGFCNHLCANEIKKLDVSIEPPAVVYTDTYSGKLYVEAAHVPDPECKLAPPRPNVKPLP